jgi:hypothetical protein
MTEIYNNPTNAELENSVFYLQNAVKVLMKKMDDVLQLKGIPGPAGQDGEDGEDAEDVDLTPYMLKGDVLHKGVQGSSVPHLHIGDNTHTWLRLGKFRFDNVGNGVLRIMDMATSERWVLEGGDSDGPVPIELEVCT